MAGVGDTTGYDKDVDDKDKTLRWVDGQDIVLMANKVTERRSLNHITLAHATKLLKITLQTIWSIINRVNDN